MDSQRFDRLAKTMAGRDSRRRFLRRIAGGALAAGLLTSVGRATAGAQEAGYDGGAFAQCVANCNASCASSIRPLNCFDNCYVRNCSRGKPLQT